MVLDSKTLDLLIEEELKAAIEDTAVAQLIGRPGPLHRTHSQYRILEAYYKTLAETDDEVLALRAAHYAAGSDSQSPGKIAG